MGSPNRVHRVILIGITCAVLGTSKASAADLSPLEQLGKQIFFDTALSTPPGQSCASCHAPEVGFTGPDSDVNRKTAVYQGAAPGRFGNRKPPSAAYASFSPSRHFQKDNPSDEGTWVGGQFWDGRADSLVEQAKGPFLNPLEMNNASAADVVNKVRQGPYRALFERVFGAKSLDAANPDAAFDRIARAIAAYETSREVNAFSSKYDAYLAGRITLTAREMRGLQLFAGAANCTACHPHDKGDDGSPPLFTDFTYDNVGTPRNVGNPFYRAMADVNPDGASYRDLGVGAVVNDKSQWGKVKVPTLRNVAKRPHPQFVKAYLHNGTFKSLKAVVRFYNRRDKTPDSFGSPEVVENVNREELGHLGLTDADEDDVVAFLETLSDGYIPTEPPPAPIHIGATPIQPRPTISNDPFRAVRDWLRVERFRLGVLEEAAKEKPARR